MTRLVTPTQLEVLKRAARRPNGNVCPTPGLRGHIQTTVLEALDRRGLITWDDGEIWHGAPRINDAGRAAIAEMEKDQ